MAKSFKVELTEQARKDMKVVAEQLGLQETEVLRRALLCLGVYVKHAPKLKHGRLAIIVDGKIIFLE